MHHLQSVQNVYLPEYGEWFLLELLLNFTMLKDVLDQAKGEGRHLEVDKERLTKVI